MQPYFSIIVPVYRVEQFLPQCVDSIIAQSFSDWELILVDDGSPDKSGNLCDAYSIKDNRINVIHVSNGGVSKARNIGCQKANGKWITYIDSDDWVNINYLEFAYNCITKNDLDLFQISANKVNYKGEIVGTNKNQTNVMNKEDYIRSRSFLSCVWGSFFKRELLMKNSIQFDEKLQYAEDQLYVMNYILVSKRLQRSGNCLYMYLQNIQSATHSSRDIGILNSIDALYRFKLLNPVFCKHIDALLMYFIVYLIKNGHMSYIQIAEKFYSLNISVNEYMSSIELQYIRNLSYSQFYAYWFLKIRSVVSRWKNVLKKYIYE